MLEQKRAGNDPNRAESDASKALDLGFDNKDFQALRTIRDDSAPIDIERLSGIDNQGKLSSKQSRDFKLKINSQQQISLEEKNDFASQADNDESPKLYEAELTVEQGKEEENRINAMLLSDQDEKNMHSQGTKNMIDEIQRFVQENQALDSMDPISNQQVY